ncbi:Collagenase [Desulfonispora thiosulfatigenes DSM 11270]|uniref:Collagenase n=1 Tax=Desulfonispora thiosulfatigenes DSM 11270 TaxID=656914 RepID=A0A1W1V3A6_DESTI|nr:collagenase [Desulfonispora thiosulfatigenes]SMB87773.1 Collagenase [Desulfonispora thiosulfatigenes DSM 11270]
MRMIIEHKLIILPLLILFLFFFMFSPSFTKVKVLGYQSIRNFYIYQFDTKTNDYEEITSNHFKVKYKGNPDNAELVLETSEEIFKEVTGKLNFTPKSQTPIIIYPTMQDFNASFGWEGDKSPMGVYWMGSIGILSPETWIEKEDKEQIFKDMGPIAHEYTHYIVDYKTNGNYTRWFTEGLAQYIEEDVTGYTLPEPCAQDKKHIYSFSCLDKNYDNQENQDLAYWQSLMGIRYLVDSHDETIINQLLDELALGNNFASSFKKVTGESLTSFESNLKKYIKQQEICN